MLPVAVRHPNFVEGWDRDNGVSLDGSNVASWTGYNGTVLSRINSGPTWEATGGGQIRANSSGSNGLTGAFSGLSLESDYYIFASYEKTNSLAGYCVRYNDNGGSADSGFPLVSGSLGTSRSYVANDAGSGVTRDANLNGAGVSDGIVMSREGTTMRNRSPVTQQNTTHPANPISPDTLTMFVTGNSGILRAWYAIQADLTQTEFEEITADMLTRFGTVEAVW